MSSNSFGNIFRITTWGESHGKAIGVVIDGCPAGLFLSEAEINQALARRAPGCNPLTSPRKEQDIAEIYSGIFDGKTTGAPISIIIHNQDADTSKYEPIKNLLRPGHANYTYLEKYGCFDYRGGGRASARETACRVAAGAVAKKLLLTYQITVLAYITSIGDVTLNETNGMNKAWREQLAVSKIFCPDVAAEAKMVTAIEQCKEHGDSLGGTIGFSILNMPVGIGDPVYEKLEANLAKAMLSIPASKGFEVGEGFMAAKMLGSMHNDSFQASETDITATNHAGGLLGGISNGMPIQGKVAFKPTSSINQTQKTIDLDGNLADFKLPKGSRHDPCVAIRAVPVVEAMCALVVADSLLMAKMSKL